MANDWTVHPDGGKKWVVGFLRCKNQSFVCLEFSIFDFEKLIMAALNRGLRWVFGFQNVHKFMSLFSKFMLIKNCTFLTKKLGICGNVSHRTQHVRQIHTFANCACERARFHWEVPDFSCEKCSTKISCGGQWIMLGWVWWNVHFDYFQGFLFFWTHHERITKTLIYFNSEVLSWSVTKLFATGFQWKCKQSKAKQIQTSSTKCLDFLVLWTKTKWMQPNESIGQGKIALCRQKHTDTFLSVLFRYLTATEFFLIRN